MRQPCAAQKELTKGENPFNTKWNNCRYEGEPIPLQTKEAIDDFKKLCSPFVHKYGENMPLCCNAEQLIILKKDLMNAESLIGSCSSCYFNFRMMWCHFACSPNQSDFVVEMQTAIKAKKNFTEALAQYKQHILNEEMNSNNESENDDKNNEEENDYNDDVNYQDKDDETKETTSHSQDKSEQHIKNQIDKNNDNNINNNNDNKSVVSNQNLNHSTKVNTHLTVNHARNEEKTSKNVDVDYHDYNNEEINDSEKGKQKEDEEEEEKEHDQHEENKSSAKRKKRQISKKTDNQINNSYNEVINKVEFFINRDFMEKLVDSCR
jgi:hypothetical protein